MFPHKDLFLCLAIYITLLHLCYCTHKKSSCVIEHSTINANNKTFNVIWKSKSHFDYAVELSDPPCLNENKSLIARICLNGTWTSQNPVCSYVEESALCPPEFIQEDDLCVFVTAPQTWERNCPYYGGFSKIEKIHNLIWLPVKRKAMYGAYEYILPGEHYGLDFFDEHSSEIADDALNTANKDCIIKSGSSIKFDSCNSLHPHFCSYKHNYFSYRCPDTCVPGGLGSNYCFCKVHKRDASNLPRNEWCQTLAVPRYSYERSIVRKLVGHDTCWIGNLQKNSYTTAEYLGHFFYLAISKDGWSLHRNGELNCAVCQVKAILYHRVDMVLKFNAQAGKLYLSVYSPESLYKGDEEDSVYCFTDATNKLKKRVETENIWDSDLDLHSGRRLKVFRVSIVEDGPGNYWCEAFQLPDASLIKSNILVAYKDMKGHDYSLRLIIYNICRFSPTECVNPSTNFITNLSKSFFNNGFLAKLVKKVRPFYIYSIDGKNGRADVLLHLTTRTRMPLIAEYFALSRNLQLWLRFKQITIVFFRSSEMCLPEITLEENMALHWQLSYIGTIRTPDQVCIQENGAPVRRQCQGDFVFGSQWGDVEGNCSQNFKLSSKTEFLHSLMWSNSSENITNEIATIIENSTDFTVLDLHYLAEVLSKASVLNQNYSPEFVEKISQIINTMMKINITTMKQSQILLNVTDEILDCFENMLSTANTSTDDVLLLKKSNLIIHISKPFLNNISGLVLYGEGDDNSFLNFKTDWLYSNTSLDYLLDVDNLEVAVYVPEKLLDVIAQNLTLDMKSNITIITTIFYTDAFFNSDVNKINAVGSRIVSVSMPGYGEFLQTTIPVIFKLQNHSDKQDCAFWNYGTSSETHSGYWSTLGGDYLGQLNNTSLEVCAFSHLTNFALLVMSDEFSVSDDESVSYNLTIDSHDKILTVISDIGCSLSVFGIFGIFLTSLVFQSWREKVGTQILIQLSITILLQVIFFNVANVRTSPTEMMPIFCTLVGIILHYVIISEFSWMLVAAVLQFFRFVRVLGPMPNRIILKAMMVGWGLPVLPIILVCAIDYQYYSAGIQGFCYPKGLGLYLGVLLPITLIVTANMAVFVCVIRNVFSLSVDTRSNSQTILKRQICLTVLLFFLLGLPWIFGLAAEVINHDSVLSYIFIYLFCFTATLQGFVLFIFYVILDKSTRSLWHEFFKKIGINRKLC